MGDGRSDEVLKEEGISLVAPEKCMNAMLLVEVTSEEGAEFGVRKSERLRSALKGTAGFSSFIKRSSDELNHKFDSSVPFQT